MGNKKTILVVDDEPFFRQVMNDILKERYVVIEAAHEDQALSLAKEHKPDLIILDMAMPEKSGIEICRDFKDDFATRDIPLVMLTSRSGTENVVEGLNAGADDYLSKPVHPPEVLARIESHLRTKGYYADLDQKDLVLLLELSETISISRNPKKILRYIVDKVADVIDVARCSIISLEGSDEIVVKASNDLVADKEIRLDMVKYPEIKKALETKNTVIINDIEKEPLIESVKHLIEPLNFKSIIVVPMMRKENIIGTFFLRTACQLVNGNSDRIIKLCQLMANISANALENAILFESMKTAQFHLERMAITDRLTGLFNHRYFYDRLEEEFARARRYDHDLACLYIDLDNFKKINDTYGHRAGDEVLKSIGLLVQEVVRESDIAARYGGEEFVVLLPETDRNGAMETARRLHSIIREHYFYSVEGEKVTVSMGVAIYDKESISSPDQLMQIADNAMYHAKAMGKDRIIDAHRSS